MVNYIRNGVDFNIILNNNIYPYTAESAQEADYLHDLIVRVRNGDAEEKELEDYLNPGKKFEKEGLIEYRNGRYRISGTSIPVDQTLAEHVIQFYKNNENVQGLLNFAKLLHLNPHKYNKEHLYEFIQRNGVVVTDQGHLVLYKSVRNLNTVDSQLAEFIGNQVRYALESGTDTDNIYVYRSEDDKLVACETEEEPTCDYCDEDGDCTVHIEYDFIGTVADLYQNGISETDDKQFTDFHSGSTDIKLGVPVSMPVENCDPDPDNSCSKGLHAGSFDYVENFGGMDKTILVVLVNPMNVVAVPYNDKLRTSEYFPVATLERENGHYKQLKSNVWSQDYLPYEARQLEELKQSIIYDDDDTQSARAQAVTTLLNQHGE